MTPIKIALDAMGGDHGPSVVIPAALGALRKCPQLQLTLVGTQDILLQQLQIAGGELGERLSLVHTTEVVAMDTLPSRALRGKRDSSMRVAINLVKDNTVDACVSAGNTGALMAIARFVLKTLPGIDRPAIISEMPTSGKKCRVLDLGANVDSRAEHLFQFAVMGSVLSHAVDNIPRPTVGLLNVGVEQIKGNEQVKQAAELLSQHPHLNYVGFVEGDDIYRGAVDVVVCDGFVGNIALKASEGIAKLLIQKTQEAFQQNLYTRLLGLLARPIIRSVRRKMDPANYNGASLIGLQGTVIKSHGSANIAAFENAILEAARQAQQNVPKLVHDKVAELLTQ